MPPADPNSLYPGAPPLTPALEADLLAWVEGEPLPPKRDEAIARLLDAHPALAARLLAMRADREALRSLADEPAPAGLLERALEALEPAVERQMLLGLAEGKPIHDHPPISIVRPQRASLWQTFTADRLGRRLALAAALLLVVGATSYFAASYLSPEPATIPADGWPADGPTIAMSEPAAAPGAAESLALDDTGSTDVLRAPLGSTGRQRFESAKAGVPAVGEPAAPALALGQAPADTSSAGLTLETESRAQALFIAAGRDDSGITPERAAELAREGRLAIRVAGLRPRSALRTIEQRLERGRAGSWRLAGPAPESVIAALATPGPPLALARAPAAEHARTLMGYEAAAPALGLPTPASAPALGRLIEPADPEPAGRLAEVRPDPEVLVAMRNAIGRAADGEAVFEVLPEPLAPAPPPVHPDAIYWWTDPPQRWTGWARVPIVIETR